MAAWVLHVTIVDLGWLNRLLVSNGRAGITREQTGVLCRNGRAVQRLIPFKTAHWLGDVHVIV